MSAALAAASRACRRAAGDGAAARRVPGARARRRCRARRPRLRPVERRSTARRVSTRSEQRWNVYALSLLAFSLCRSWSCTCSSACRARCRSTRRRSAVCRGAGVQHRGQLRDQHELADLRRRVDDEPPHPDGRAGGAELRLGRGRASRSRSRSIRGLARRRTATIGNFWVDLDPHDRPHPAAARRSSFALRARRARAWSRTCTGPPTVHDASRARRRRSPGGPVASQEAIKELGTNGGGFFNANSAHPFENPTPLTNLLEMLALLADPVRARLHVRADGRRPAAGLGACSRRCSCSGSRSRWSRWRSRRTATRARPSARPASTRRSRRQHGGQGGPLRRRRLRRSSRRRRPARRPARSTAMHDSFTPLGGAVPLVQHDARRGHLRAASASGLYGMLIFALLAVFIAGLMVGRTPEYLGKKIQAAEMKLVVLYILVVPRSSSASPRSSVLLDTAQGVDPQPGPARLHRDPLRVHLGGEQQRLGLRRPDAATPTGTTRRSALAMLVGRFLPDHPGAGDRRLAGAQAAGAGDRGHLPDRHAAVRRRCSSAWS